MSLEITKKLISNSDEKYGDFTSKLIPTVNRSLILGVRAPIVDEIAKEAVKNGEYLDFLEEKHTYMEEFSVHGAILGYAKFPCEELISRLEKFLPYIDNWAVCDSTASGLKQIKKNYPLFLEKCKEWLKSDRIYTVRFAIVVLLSFYLNDEFDENILFLVSNVRSEEYYVNMAIAWFYSFALIKQYDAAIKIFEEKKLENVWVHNKSIQKARESFRISPERKEYLNSLKIVSAKNKLRH